MSRKTVFVLGAGASAEAGLPVGEGLKNSIAEILNFNLHDQTPGSGDSYVFDAIRKLDAGGKSKYISAALLIKNNMPLAGSIDNFIDAHRGNAPIEQSGKIAIAAAILKAEQNSKLYFKDSTVWPNVISKLDKTWYLSLWKMLVSNCNVEQISSRLQQVAFIVFNYDRCLEHFMLNALMSYYNIPVDRAVEIMSNCSIFHPYGQVGHLPYFNSSMPVNFGSDQSSNRLIQIADSLKTFTEGTDESSSDVIAIRQAIDSSEKIVFLGFAYHDQNLDVIIPKKDRPRAFSILGSANGISMHDRESIAWNINSRSSQHPVSLGPGRVAPTNITLDSNMAFQFINDHSRVLTFS